MALSIVILAAGQGKRMNSNLPKVLHPLAGKPLLEHVVTTVTQLKPVQKPLIIYGHQGDILKQQLASLDVNWIEQKQQLGTGHALQQALPSITADNRVLVLYGDVPLITVETLQHFIASTPADAVGIMTALLSNPSGYGRIIRNGKNKIINIIEDKDTTPTEKEIKEINSGIYLIPVKYLQKWLPQLQNKNSQQEYYLTDIIHLALKDKIEICAIHPKEAEEVLGINDRIQLAQLERLYQQREAKRLMLQGVTIYDPQRIDIRGKIVIGKDVVIDVNVIFEGKVVIGNQCRIGPNTFLRNVNIGDNVEILANSVIDGAEIANNCIIGPFARLRPGTQLNSAIHIGNFVEIKNSIIGENTKINHLSYIGDSELGKKVNIGAGTITCNYDGANKHRTLIGDEVFIGSNSQLVAPVSIGTGATIGAGSTITRDAPANQLTLTRAEQRSIANWQRPKKKEKES
jgi:bifunctional UDP-N-acetylglucosamine pyrophosphorylase/glucosamine-1-phosphate N-acetyltransferase